jgi:hypothetical protein
MEKSVGQSFNRKKPFADVAVGLIPKVMYALAVAVIVTVYT